MCIRDSADLLAPLGDRNLFSLLQAHARMPASSEPQSDRHRDPNLLCDYCLLANQLVDGQEANTSHVRNDLFLLLWHGRRRRADRSHQKIARTACVRIPQESLHAIECCAVFDPQPTQTQRRSISSSIDARKNDAKYQRKTNFKSRAERYWTCPC